jgi:hypothetical protein
LSTVRHRVPRFAFSNVPNPGIRPLFDLSKHSFERATGFGQGVLRMRRSSPHHLALNEPRLDQLLEPDREHPVGDTWHCGPDLAEATRAAEQGPDHTARPSAAEDQHRAVEGLTYVGHLVGPARRPFVDVTGILRSLISLG